MVVRELRSWEHGGLRMEGKGNLFGYEGLGKVGSVGVEVIGVPADLPPKATSLFSCMHHSDKLVIQMSGFS